MAFRYEVRLSGQGGQGMITAGIILAEAASIYNGHNALQSQSYGPEARGGASKSEVIISDQDIDHPKAENIDFLLAISQEAYDKYAKDVKPEGIILIDKTDVTPNPEITTKTYAVPITDIVYEIGKSFVINIVSLGALAEIAKIVSPEAIEKAIVNRVPKGTEEINLRAFEAGRMAARKVIGKE